VKLCSSPSQPLWRDQGRLCYLERSVEPQSLAVLVVSVVAAPQHRDSGSCQVAPVGYKRGSRRLPSNQPCSSPDVGT
jgi:hypothetical protein